jgi:hypothetical protein
MSDFDDLVVYDEKPKRGEQRIDPKKAIVASKVIKNPDFFLNPLPTYILLINDEGNPGQQNLIEAINLLADMGWEVVSTSMDSMNRMYALMRRVD